MGALGQIHDPQAPMPEGAPAQAEQAFAVRAARGLHPRHVGHGVKVRHLLIETYFSCDTAHRWSAPFPQARGTSLLIARGDAGFCPRSSDAMSEFAYR
ncbi:hypothetical protein OJJOAM_003629 [Cupriavidus sp. H18C1]